MLSKKAVIVCAAAAALNLYGVTQAQAAVVSTGFESTSGYTLDASGNGTATRSTDQAHNSSYSAKLTLDDTKNDFAKVILDVAPGKLKLGTTSGKYSYYIPGTPVNDQIPYMYFGVDTNKNGVFDFTGDNSGDSFVITFEFSSPVSNQWTDYSLDGTHTVHVVGNRTGLAAGTFSSTNGGGLLSDLYTMDDGGTSWSDLDILQVRVGVGETGGVTNDYVAYVDDVSAVPEPSSLAIFVGLGGLALLSRRTRRKIA